jgi:uracil-DNA glycosylase
MFNLDKTHHSWHNILKKALSHMDQHYLIALSKDDTWLPGKDKIFNAFQLSLDKLKRILFGESPYPRQISANGFAFWDNAVKSLWSEKGLSKEVNRATSLRNFMKMLLTIENKSVSCDKSHFVQTLDELFHNLLNHGFLLLNATLVYRKDRVKEDAKYWRPFLAVLLDEIYKHKPATELIFFGKIAQQIEPLILHPYKKIVSEHPYNLTFIQNPVVLKYFKQFHLLEKFVMAQPQFSH